MKKCTQIIQAEFFHISFEEDCLESNQRQCADRSEQGSPTKTALRFYDDGDIMLRVLEEANLKKLKDKLALQHELKGFRLYWRNIRHRRVIRRINKLEEKRVPFLVQTIKEGLDDRKTLLIMTNDFYFRPLRHDEEHELLEAIQKSEEAYIYVFEYTDLFSDTLQSLIHIT
jgi:hypothetical protein